MQCYTELTPPTAVTHSIALPFVSAQSNNLVVAKSSLLQIYSTKSVSAELDSSLNSTQQSIRPDNKYEGRLINDEDGLEASWLGGDGVLQKSDRGYLTKLVLVAEIPLSGTVTGLSRIKTPTSLSGGDGLLIAFKDAKLSLVHWDPSRLTVSTTSIHYYEQDELQGSPWAAPLNDYVSFLVADPGSRCAALKFGARNLAILPFKQPDEDIDMDDWDEELDGPRPAKDLSSAVVSGTSNIEETPYSPSFVLRLSNLDSTLLFPVHLAFLHEYREPTFGILSSTQSSSHSLGRKDHFSYTVFTLDLQQKASTTILSVGGLPQDLFRVVPLQAPVGGALLVGANELIHIDQSGKPNGVAVNPLTKQATSFGLVDQSSLNLQLERCVIDTLSAENGELIMALNDGRLALITFRIDGRTVSGLSVKMVAREAGGSIIPCGISSFTRVGRSSMFAGIEDGDSIVFGWTRKQSHASRRKSKIPDTTVDLDLDDEELDDEDDIYGDEPAAPLSTTTSSSASKTGEPSFRVHDRLLSIAPIRAMSYGKPVPLLHDEDGTNSLGVRSELNLACAVGRGKSCSLAIINREIQPRVIGRFDFPEARGLWTVCAQRPMPKAIQGDKSGGSVGNTYDTTAHYDNYMIVAKVDLDGYETSDVYALNSTGFESLADTEFEPAAGMTIEAGTMGKHMRIIQVLKSEVRCYDGGTSLP
jgi:cleavage and polyadenylation specificity factor subunit 1